jgi:hypothetical protein
MSKAPPEAKVREYDETLRFCKVMVAILNAVEKHSGRQPVFPSDFVQDSWRSGKQPFGAASRSWVMFCRDLLEMTQDHGGEVLRAWDQDLSEYKAVTLSAMRARHWKLIPKILKRARIRNEDEFYLVKSHLDSPEISADEQAALVALVDAYQPSSRSR